VSRVQTPQHVQELQREFKIREGFGLELLETIQPTYILAAPVGAVASQGYPRTCVGTINGTAGGVGENVQNSITGPGNRGIIYQITRILTTFVTDGSVDLRIDDGVAIAATETVSISKRFTDARIPQLASIPDAVLAESSPLTAAQDGQLIGRIAGLAATMVDLPVSIILGAGTYFLMSNQTTNENMFTTYFWTEYLLEDR